MIILTIAVGFIFRSLAGGVWGADPVSFDTPYGGMVITLSENETGRTMVAVRDSEVSARWS